MFLGGCCGNQIGALQHNVIGENEIIVEGVLFVNARTGKQTSLDCLCVSVRPKPR